jgi:uncharacterized coiled-coil DUF342 family protein
MANKDKDLIEDQIMDKIQCLEDDIEMKLAACITYSNEGPAQSAKVVRTLHQARGALTSQLKAIRTDVRRCKASRKEANSRLGVSQHSLTETNTTLSSLKKEMALLKKENNDLSLNTDTEIYSQVDLKKTSQSGTQVTENQAVDILNQSQNDLTDDDIIADTQKKEDIQAPSPNQKDEGTSASKNDDDEENA